MLTKQANIIFYFLRRLILVKRNNIILHLIIEINQSYNQHLPEINVTKRLIGANGCSIRTKLQYKITVENKNQYIEMQMPIISQIFSYIFLFSFVINSSSSISMLLFCGKDIFTAGRIIDLQPNAMKSKQQLTKQIIRIKFKAKLIYQIKSAQVYVYHQFKQSFQLKSIKLQSTDDILTQSELQIPSKRKRIPFPKSKNRLKNQPLSYPLIIQ
ncbi:transmembrane protein, putative (macronuclear) [Tetrahymena thermophila SB210]|uniref:Transmembrane protein, putative n=1 Tax=Tetrahymena thermophila (strain SB210) TaxID=312017 RepID=W7X0N0_TETTS|nr:transmembrane protein, putative [Tetrahymena thermophila SB210]EWS72705.1 transmembrane protein, putative [Tetrahymena thermophila SB210]|eukprot:XP_012654759.1 transmembrane protein, putative [Tetrahymena thermophila SB210]